VKERVTQEVTAAKRANPKSRLGPVIEGILDRALPEVLRTRRGVPKAWPGSRFTAHAVAKAVRPIVEDIRRQAFGTTAHLKSAEAFEEWAAPSIEVRNKAWAQGGEVWPRTSYDELLKNVRTKVMPLTGWTEHFALQHVALGRKVPSGFVGSTTRSDIAPPWAQVTFYPWQMNEQCFQYLRAVLGKLLHDPNLPKRVGGWGRPYSPEDLKLLDLLAEVGAPPQSQGKGKAVGRTEYWQRLSAAWGKRYKERVKPNALRMRWERFAATHPEDRRFF